MEPLILIALADESLRISCGLHFAERGYRVVTASGGLDCLTKLCRLVPEVLILDKDLLWGGAEGVLAVLRDGGNTVWPPVVLLTNDRSDQLHEARPAPVVACLRKSVGFAELIEEVEAVRRDGQFSDGAAAQGWAVPSGLGVPSRL